MFWPIFIYVILSIALSITGGRNAGITVALCTAAASVLALAAGGGLRASLKGPRSQRIAGALIACVLLALAAWAALHFSASLFGLKLSGQVWIAIGFVLCFVFADKKILGIKKDA